MSKKTKELSKLADAFEQKVKKYAIQHLKQDSCEYPEGCDNPAIILCFGDFDGWPKQFWSLCKEHSNWKIFSPGSEYHVDCPNCKCKFGVG